MITNLNDFKKKSIETINENKPFYRLTKKDIGNDAYTLMKDAADLYDSLNKGIDVNINTLDNLINGYTALKAKAKLFNSPAELEDDYK